MELTKPIIKNQDDAARFTGQRVFHLINSTEPVNLIFICLLSFYIFLNGLAAKDLSHKSELIEKADLYFIIIKKN